MIVITVARKPVSAEGGGTIVGNVIRHGTGAINVDGSRIGTSKQVPGGKPTGDFGKHGLFGKAKGCAEEDGGRNPNIGRWPANVIFEHKVGCKQTGTRKVKTGVAVRKNGASGFAGGLYDGKALGEGPDASFADPDGTETVPAWACASGCPVADLDRQSSQMGMHLRGNVRPTTSGGGTGITVLIGDAIHADHHLRKDLSIEGGASRFFKCFGGVRP
jgi:hypothetical protein